MILVVQFKNEIQNSMPMGTILYTAPEIIIFYKILNIYYHIKIPYV